MATAAHDEFRELMRDKGHRSRHPTDDDNDFDSDSERDTSDPVPPPAASRPSINLARDTIPRTRYASNTGPKGVIADAQNFRDSRRAAQRQQQRSGITNGGRAGVAIGEAARQKPSQQNHEDDEDEKDDDDEEDDDDEFISEWRQARLQELQNGGGRQPLAFGQLRKTWTGVSTVDANGFLDAVEKSPAQTTVVVYIYDDQSAVSDAIEASLRDLAPAHPAVRFVRLHFLLAKIEPAGVPALLAYRAGELETSLVPVVDELPDDAELSAGTLEAVLRRHQILRG